MDGFVASAYQSIVPRYPTMSLPATVWVALTVVLMPVVSCASFRPAFRDLDIGSSSEGDNSSNRQRVIKLAQLEAKEKKREEAIRLEKLERGLEYEPIRFLQTNDTTLEDGVQPAHHTCATALDVQPPGPGQETVLVNETTSFHDLEVDRLFFCSDFSLDGGRFLFYKFTGTGNAFFITTCDHPEPPPSIPFRTLLEMVPNVNCTVDKFGDPLTDHVCLRDEYGSDLNCPQDGSLGVSVAIETEEGVEYAFSIRTHGPGVFTLRVGETNSTEALSDNSCPAAEELVLPPIVRTEGATRRNPDTSSLVVVRDNYGIYNTEYESMCGKRYSWDHIAAGKWFVMEAPEIAAELTISTCSNATTLAGTFIGIMLVKDNVPPEIRGNSTELCDLDHLICYKREDFNSDCDGLVTLQYFVTRPGERYYIYVSSLYAFDYGQFELNITAEYPPSRIWMHDDYQLRRVNRRTGVSCYDQGGWYNPGPIVCWDACEYCEDHTSILPGMCFNRTDFTELDTDFNESLNGYRVTADWSGGKNDTFTYVANSDGTCTAFLNGVSCTTCTNQDCGAPLVDCTNVTGVGGTPWQSELDLCLANSTVFYTGTGDHNFEGTCKTYLSEYVCNSSAVELETSTGLSCSCSLNSWNGASDLVCTTECGLFCGFNNTVCGTKTIEDVIDATGYVDKQVRSFSYVAGLEEDRGPYEISFRRGSSCYTSIPQNFFSGCDECSRMNCGDVQPDPFFMGVELDCTNVEGGIAYDTCASNITLDRGPFMYLGREFEQCVDIVPAAVNCENAVPLTLGEPVLGSTLYLPTPTKIQDQEECTVFDDPGIYYTFNGTGGWLRVSTCSNNTKDSAHDLYIIEGPPCGKEAVNRTCRSDIGWKSCNGIGEQKEFQSDAGTEYTLYVEGSKYSEGGQFELVVEEFEYIISVEHCRLDFPNANVEDYNCTCLEHKEYETSGLACQSTCSRCDGIHCVDVYDLNVYDDDGHIRDYAIFNITSGPESGLSMVYREEIGYRNRCYTWVGETDGGFDNAIRCGCEFAECADGTKKADINCTEFRDNLFLSLCEEEPSNPLNVLSSLAEFGACDEAGLVTGQPQTLVIGSPSASPTQSPNAPLASGAAILSVTGVLFTRYIVSFLALLHLAHGVDLSYVFSIP